MCTTVAQCSIERRISKKNGFFELSKLEYSFVQKFLSFDNHSLSSNTYFAEFENFRKTLKRIHPPLQFMISVDDPGKTLRTSAIVRQEITARLIGILKEAIHIFITTSI